MKKQVLVNDKVVELVAVNGGWTIVRDGGKEFKVRNGAVSEVPAAATASRSAVDPQYKARLVRSRVELPSGEKKPVQDCGDALALELRLLALPEVYEAAAQALSEANPPRKEYSQLAAQDILKKLQAKYSHLNPGLQRMSLGNLIRGSK